MTNSCIHLELFRGRAWKGDAVQDLEFVWLFAGVGSHNIHIQTFPGLKWVEMQQKNEEKRSRSDGNTLHKNPHKMNTQRPLTTNLYVFFHEFSPANFHPTDPEPLICFVHFGNTETKLSSIKICLGNFASRCDLAKKPKNGISCCSLSDRPSVMTWAVAPSSSVAARSNNKVLPAFP